MRPPYLLTPLVAVALVLLALLVLSGSAAGQASPPAPAQTPPAPAEAAPAEAAPADDRESLPIPEGSPGPASVGGDMGGTALRLLLGLAVVVALILGVWQLMKRMQRGRYPALAETSTGLISVVATTPLGPNRALHLVRVGDEVVLVGATDHAVQPVARLDADTAATIVAALGSDDEGLGALARRRAYETSGGPAGLLERLRAMTTRS